MAQFTISDIQIRGLAASVPKEKASIWEYDLLSEKEQRLFVKTTGVRERRIAPRGMATSDLCLAASEALIADLKWKKSDIDVIIFLSQSRDYYLPATAIILQDRLGLSKSCLAFDVGLGCSGYVYGLSIMSSLLSRSGLKKGLLLMGDISSATCAYEDKSTYPLFGDAGTATALEFDEHAAPMHFNLQSDGSGYEAIMIPHGGIRNLVSPESFEMKQIADGISRSQLNLALDGMDVFNFSVSEVPPAVLELCNYSGQSPEEYDYFVMHQANRLMNETIRKKLKLEAEKVPYSIQDYGNTSSASIPLTMLSELRRELQSGSRSLLLSGFGVGLSWGVVGLKTKDLVCPEIIEL